jgi:hypothetical protein
LYKGAEAEKRSLEQIRSHYRELPWIKYARKATKKEDHEGIDIVVYTKDAGELFVQIKSSYKHAQQFCRKHPGKFIIIIIVREEYSDDMVWREVKGGLIRGIYYVEKRNVERQKFIN